MANTMYLTIEGESTGAIKGDCQQAGREDMILVYAVDHSVQIPRYTHTGLPTGQRIHLPLKITKHKDQATPLLYQLCCTGEHVKTFKLDYFRIDATGKEVNYFTIELFDAIVVEMREYTPTTFLPENKPYHDMDEVSFTYSKIIWTYTDGGITCEDDWKAPAA